MLHMKSFELKKLEEMLWKAIESNDETKREIVQKEYFPLLTDFCEPPILSLDDSLMLSLQEKSHETNIDRLQTAVRGTWNCWKTGQLL